MGGGSKKGGGQQATDYRMAVHAGICMAADAVTGVYIDGYTAWEGEVDVTTPGAVTTGTSGFYGWQYLEQEILALSGADAGLVGAQAPGTSSFSINQPNLFGGPTAGGGAVGTVEVMFGGPTQLAPPALCTALGGTQATLPGFRGYLSLLFHDITNGGFLWTTNNPIIAQNVDVRMRWTTMAAGLDPTIARIPDAQDVGFIAGIGASTSDTATHAANSINASSQYFSAVASGNVVTITEINNDNEWIDSVSPVADTTYPFRASIVSETDSTQFWYYYDITSFGSPSDDSGTSGEESGPRSGVATLTFENVPLTGMTFSIGPENYTFTSYAGDDANPAHIIYEVITNTDWGLGYPESLIDVASFSYAASVLFGESLGLSMMWAQQSSVEDFINEVLNHISATLFISPLTGLFTIKLLRGDYDTSTLPVYTPDNAVMSSFQRKMWAETVNEIVVSWTNPVTEQIETIYAQNLANIAIQGGIVSDSRNYYGVRNSPLAAQLAAREIVAVSSPLCSMDMEVNRSEWAEVPGGCVVVNWPENSLEGLVMRVGKVDYGSTDEPTIKVTLMEDVFGLSRPAVVSAPATLWVDPSTAPEDIPTYQILTLPYFFSTSNDLAGSVANLVYPEVQVAVLAYDANRDTTGFDLYSELTLANGTQTWANLGTKNICEEAPSALMVPAATSTIPCAAFTAADRAPVVGGFILIGTGDTTQELMLVTATDGTNYTVNRGALDTVPQPWVAGSPMWSIKPNVSIIDTSSTYAAGETVTYKLLENTSQGQLDISAATARSATLTARYYQPLRPANVQVNGVGFGPVAIGSATTLVVSWATRNRTLEDGTALAWTAASVAPEYWQETVVSVYDQSNNLVYQQQGSLWTDTSVTLQASWFARYTTINIVVSSQLNGVTKSLQGFGIKVTGLPGTSGAALPPAPPAATTPPSPVAAPSAANWSVTGGSVTGTGGDSVPAIIVTGTQESSADQDLVIRYKLHGTSIWTVAPMVVLNGQSISTQITGVAATTSYDVELAYQESYGTAGSNILSNWLVPSTSPVTTGASAAVSAVNSASLGGVAASVFTANIAAAAAAASTAQAAAAAAQTTANTATTAAGAAQTTANSATSNLTAEISRAESAEGTLTTSIASLTSTVTGNNTTQTAAVTAEALARSTADTALSALITSLTSTVTSNNTTITANLTSEAGTRAAADSALSALVTTLQSNYSSLSSTVSTNYVTLSNANSATVTSIANLAATITDGANLIRTGTFLTSLGSWGNGVVNGPGSGGLDGTGELDVTNHDTYETGNVFAVFSGQVYFVDAWVWTGQSSSSSSIGIGLYCTDASGGTQQWITGATIAGGLGWNHIKGSLTIPSGAVFATPWLTQAVTSGAQTGLPYVAWDHIYISTIPMGADILATISTEATTRAAADSALSALVTTLQSNYSSLSSTVSTNYSTLSTAQSTTASALTSLTSTVGSNSSSITTLNSVTATLTGQVYGTVGFSLNANGAIASMVAYASGGATTTSSIVFDASSFIIKSSTHPNIAPFYYDATSGTLFVNSVTINTGNVAANAITNVVSAFTSGSMNAAASSANTNVQSASTTIVSGAYLVVSASVNVSSPAAATAQSAWTMKIYVDGADCGLGQVALTTILGTSSVSVPQTAMMAVSVPLSLSAGSHTIAVMITATLLGGSVGGGSLAISSRALTLLQGMR